MAEVGKSKNKVRFKRKNRRDVCRGERRDTRLLAPHLRGTHGIAGDADDTILFAEKVESLDRLFFLTDPPRRWKLAHACILLSVTLTPVSYRIGKDQSAGVSEPFHKPSPAHRRRL